jgi:hypothetical protein
MSSRGPQMDLQRLQPDEPRHLGRHFDHLITQKAHHMSIELNRGSAICVLDRPSAPAERHMGNERPGVARRCPEQPKTVNPKP